jgi:Rrf2 family protein
MELSKTSAHAALAVVYLANHPNEVVQGRQIAASLSIATDSALKILQTLAKRGLISSQLGRTGGYKLSRPADDITLLEIVEAIDGPITANVPIKTISSELAAGYKVLRNVCERSAELVRNELTNKTVANLLKGVEPQILVHVG